MKYVYFNIRYLFLIIFFVLCLLLFNISLVIAQDNFGFTPVEIDKIPWGNSFGEVGLYKAPERNYGPQSFAINEEDKKIYILDSQNSRILIYDEDKGIFSKSVSIEPKGDDITLGVNQNIYILYKPKRKIKEYNLNGEILNSYTVPRLKNKKPITGIYFVKEKGLFFKTSDQKSFPVLSIQKGIKKKIRTEKITQKITQGLFVGDTNKTASARRESEGLGKVKITDYKDILVHKIDNDICGLYIIGNDNSNNIYLIAEEFARSLNI